MFPPSSHIVKCKIKVTTVGSPVESRVTHRKRGSSECQEQTVVIRRLFRTVHRLAAVWSSLLRLSSTKQPRAFAQSLLFPTKR